MNVDEAAPELNMRLRYALHALAGQWLTLAVEFEDVNGYMEMAQNETERSESSHLWRLLYICITSFEQ